MLVQTRLEALTNAMQKHRLNGYIISTTDEFLSEYAPNCAKRLEYITGFSGSNGFAIIMAGGNVIFFTDGRYITQAKIELDSAIFKIFDLKYIKEFDWKNYFSNSDLIGYDPKIFTKKFLDNFPSLNLVSLEENLIDTIWRDRPDPSKHKIYEYPENYAGFSYKEKIQQMRLFLKQHKANSIIITHPASVCWLLNIRAQDVEFSPLLLANLVITHEHIYLFTDTFKVSEEIVKARPELEFLPTQDFANIILSLTGKIIFDKTLASCYVKELLSNKEHISLPDPSIQWKAIKNNQEIFHLQQGHIYDARAMCEFLAEFYSLNDTERSKLTEYDIGLMLTDYRSKQPGYVSDSFPSICGFKENGAIIHYRAAKDTAKKIEGDGLLLIDSGGQYLGATTDITRTIAIGKVATKIKDYYTRILKGHIALATIKFPKNAVSGAHLDALARQYLWAIGDDYAHGTGHGVGAFLSVHEGPQSVNLANFQTKICASMVISNEPGYYVPGEFGIRIENMLYAKTTAEYPDFLEFENLTLVPYCKELIDFSMLTSSEIDFLAKYYAKIHFEVRPILSSKAASWLDENTNIN